MPDWYTWWEARQRAHYDALCARQCAMFDDFEWPEGLKHIWKQRTRAFFDADLERCKREMQDLIRQGTFAAPPKPINAPGSGSMQ